MGVRIRVRYAPSPTGHLHIGGARTALFNWLFARRHGGAMILRIEDTDRARQIPGAEDKMIEALRWLGLDWDEGPDVGGAHGPYRSTERLHLYRPLVNRLLEEKKAYRCYCTQEELTAEREQMRRRGLMPRYSGRCRGLTEDDWRRLDAEGREFTVRFRVPEGQRIEFEDLVRGRVAFDSDGIGDFVIVKSDGIPTYHFAVTVDDHLMEISHVIRGEEHLSNTAGQLLLYRAFGFPPPIFAHVPLILNESGKKLSKRDETIVQFVEQYRDLGYVPEAVVNDLALLGWSPGDDREILSLKELVREFSFDRVGKSGAVFDPRKLRWMNAHYLRGLSDEELLELCWPHLVAAGLAGSSAGAEDRQWALRAVQLYRDQLEYGAQLPELAGWLKNPPAPGPEEEEILKESSAQRAVAAFYQEVSNLSDWSPEEIQAVFKRVQKATGLRGRGLFMPVRAAATGRIHGPELARVLSLLGRDVVLPRLRDLLERCGVHLPVDSGAMHK
ncbi:MAG: glutamate--tRNA ligase [Kyrpidia sp.]|nr:glutamate--tRNA ligase [Kyrpidia sp.]